MRFSGTAAIAAHPRENRCSSVSIVVHAHLYCVVSVESLSNKTARLLRGWVDVDWIHAGSGKCNFEAACQKELGMGTVETK